MSFAAGLFWGGVHAGPELSEPLPQTPDAEGPGAGWAGEGPHNLSPFGGTRGSFARLSYHSGGGA